MGFMTIEEDYCDTAYYLRVVAQPDPGVLPRVLGHLQNLNIVPNRVLAELSTCAVVHIQIDVFGLPEPRLTLIVAKVGQLPSVTSAHWHRLCPLVNPKGTAE
jgi:hypothetical protein